MCDSSEEGAALGRYRKPKSSTQAAAAGATSSRFQALSRSAHPHKREKRGETACAFACVAFVLFLEYVRACDVKSRRSGGTPAPANESKVKSMADMNRRKGGATAARSHQSYLQNTAANTAVQNPQFQAYQQQQQSPYQYQFQQQQLQYKQQQQAKMAGAPPAATNRYTRDRAGPVRGGQQKSPVSAKMGIKSGMTVEVRC